MCKCFCCGVGERLLKVVFWFFWFCLALPYTIAELLLVSLPVRYILTVLHHESESVLASGLYGAIVGTVFVSFARVYQEWYGAWCSAYMATLSLLCGHIVIGWMVYLGCAQRWPLYDQWQCFRSELPFRELATRVAHKTGLKKRTAASYSFSMPISANDPENRGESRANFTADHLHLSPSDTPRLNKRPSMQRQSQPVSSIPMRFRLLQLSAGGYCGFAVGFMLSGFSVLSTQSVAHLSTPSGAGQQLFQGDMVELVDWCRPSPSIHLYFVCVPFFLIGMIKNMAEIDEVTFWPLPRYLKMRGLIPSGQTKITTAAMASRHEQQSQRTAGTTQVSTTTETSDDEHLDWMSYSTQSLSTASRDKHSHSHPINNQNNSQSSDEMAHVQEMYTTNTTTDT